MAVRSYTLPLTFTNFCFVFFRLCRLSSSLPLPTSRKDPLAKRLQQKYVPAIENAVPLVEFNFYYKSNGDPLATTTYKVLAD